MPSEAGKPLERVRHLRRDVGGRIGEKAVCRVISQSTEGSPGTMIRPLEIWPSTPRQFVLGFNFIA